MVLRLLQMRKMKIRSVFESVSHHTLTGFTGLSFAKFNISPRLLREQVNESNSPGAVVVWAAVVFAVDGTKTNPPPHKKTREAEEQRLGLEIGCLVFDETHEFDMHKHSHSCELGSDAVE